VDCAAVLRACGRARLTPRAAPSTHELGGTIDGEPTGARQPEMAHVARNEGVGASRNRHFQKRPVGLVRQFQSERRRRDTFTCCFQQIQEIRDVGIVKAELRSAKNGSVLSQDAVVGEKSDFAGQEQVEDATGIAFRVQQARHDNVRVENDSQAERRRRRTSRISRLIPAMESLLRPVSAAFLRMRDTARIALTLRMA